MSKGNMALITPSFTADMIGLLFGGEGVQGHARILGDPTLTTFFVVVFYQ